MNILRIAGKELKVFRDIKMLLFMLATPVLLMLILGTALSGNFHGTVKVDPIRVLYSYNSTSSAVGKQWEAFLLEAKASGIRFEEATSRTETDVVKDVQNGLYTGYARIADKGISYYGNSGSGKENGIVQGLLAALADRYRLTITETGLSASNGNYVTEASVDAVRQPGGLDYFAVAVTTMIILYSALTAGQLIETERSRHTDLRLLVSPVTKGEIFAGKIVGTLVLNAIFVAIIVLLSKYMFGANWGEHLWLVFLVLLTEIVLALSLGLGVGYCLKGNAAGSVLMIVIQAAAFVGGAYTPVDQTTGMMNFLSRYSPLHWSNDAILQIIYAGNLMAAPPAMMLNLGCSILLLALAIVLMRRREGL
ncbi:ABC transporter permease [Paenibacillus terrigena]|uniref:ABC transporter permease n=1 Tax=Paenibacillus terrigena TaxID=369333 RepID=UPI00037FD3FB|nr:ABC transporter permease [Paenibacillus terrigena]